jgi:hypothetical protein
LRPIFNFLCTRLGLIKIKIFKLKMTEVEGMNGIVHTFQEYKKENNMNLMKK